MFAYIMISEFLFLMRVFQHVLWFAPVNLWQGGWF